MNIPASVSLAIVLPTTLQIPNVNAPASFDFFIAANVSAVSPDWLTAIKIVFASIIALRYLNSDAYSTCTGTLAYSSIKCFPIKPACHDVPQAVIYILDAVNILGI